MKIYTTNYEFWYAIGYIAGAVSAVIMFIITILTMIAIINISKNIEKQNELKKRKILLKESEMLQKGMIIPPSPNDTNELINQIKKRSI